MTTCMPHTSHTYTHTHTNRRCCVALHFPPFLETRVPPTSQLTCACSVRNATAPSNGLCARNAQSDRTGARNRSGSQTAIARAFTDRCLTVCAAPHGCTARVCEATPGVVACRACASMQSECEPPVRDGADGKTDCASDGRTSFSITPPDGPSDEHIHYCLLALPCTRIHPHGIARQSAMDVAL